MATPSLITPPQVAAPAPEPIDEVRRDLRDIGDVFYRVRADGGCVVFSLNDDEDLTVVTFEPAQAEQLINDLRAVLAAVEVSNG